MARTKTRPAPAAAAPALTTAQVKAAKKKAADDIKTCLEDVCSFKEEAAEAIVDDQGYSDLDELCLSDNLTCAEQYYLGIVQLHLVLGEDQARHEEHQT